jgi:hypothetical protein
MSFPHTSLTQSKLHTHTTPGAARSTRTNLKQVGISLISVFWLTNEEIIKKSIISWRGYSRYVYCVLVEGFTDFVCLSKSLSTGGLLFGEEKGEVV